MKIDFSYLHPKLNNSTVNNRFLFFRSQRITQSQLLFPTLQNNRTFLMGLIFTVLGAFGFSTKSIFIKLAYSYSSNVSALNLLTLRMLFSLPFFVLATLWLNRKTTNSQKLKTKQILSLIILGMMGYYLASYLDFIGLRYITAGLERVILFLYPTFVVLISAIFFKRLISLREIIALIISYSGLFLFFLQQLNGISNDLWLGSLSVLGSAIIFACFTMGSAIMVKQIGSARFTAYSMMAAGCAIVIHYSVSEKWELFDFPNQVYWITLMMALFATVLPAFFMNAGIKRVGPVIASVISSIGPIATLILAYYLLNETVTKLQIIGTLLVLTGVFVISRAKS